jgi:hypothetical protein
LEKWTAKIIGRVSVNVEKRRSFNDQKNSMCEKTISLDDFEVCCAQKTFRILWAKEINSHF